MVSVSAILLTCFSVLCTANIQVNPDYQNCDDQLMRGGACDGAMRACDLSRYLRSEPSCDVYFSYFDGWIVVGTVTQEINNGIKTCKYTCTKPTLDEEEENLKSAEIKRAVWKKRFTIMADSKENAVAISDDNAKIVPDYQNCDDQLMRGGACDGAMRACDLSRYLRSEPSCDVYFSYFDGWIVVGTVTQEINNGIKTCKYTCTKPTLEDNGFANLVAQRALLPSGESSMGLQWKSTVTWIVVGMLIAFVGLKMAGQCNDQVKHQTYAYQPVYQSV